MNAKELHPVGAADKLINALVEYYPADDVVDLINFVTRLEQNSKHLVQLYEDIHDYPFIDNWRMFCKAHGYPIDIRRKGHEYVNWIRAMHVAHSKSTVSGPFYSFLEQTASHQEGLGNEDGAGI